MGSQEESETVVGAAALSGDKTPSQVETDELPSPVVTAISRKSSVLMVVVSGLALLSDGYNIQVVGYMYPILSQLYPEAFTSDIKTRLSNALLVGGIVGILFFGWAIDRLGRRTGIFWSTFFLVLGVVLTTAAHGTTPRGLFWMMVVGRGVSGFGFGGEFAVAAVGSTEAAEETRPRLRALIVGVATTFAVDLGFVVGGIVSIVVVEAYGRGASDGVWRVTFGIGFVLPLALLFFRLRLVNSTQYRRHVLKSRIPYRLCVRRYWKPMLGTIGVWFFYDFVVYPFGVFATTIIGTLNPQNTLVQNIGFGTVVNCFYLPGAFLGGFLMDRIGRKNTVTLGFALWAVMGFILGGALGPIQSVFPLFVVLYGIFLSVGEMGPGVGNFVCSSESFPTPIRGHFLGLAGAFGKAGATIGSEVFAPIQNRFADPQKGVQAVFLIGAAFAAVGGLIAWFLLPDMTGRDLEEEDVRFRRYLEENGYEGVYGESMAAEIRSTAFKVGRESTKR
ncbi:hypothetical protein VTK73DRAFT_8032 [Phialemonium thermophilum]|uniref:Major facilitator superfamily (MFS) profile domain-containing protein n=1 Tax=Phialemonium thermophilum TaxID=223376 RepID=A0ABR3WB46_9PEZI